MQIGLSLLLGTTIRLNIVECMKIQPNSGPSLYMPKDGMWTFEPDDSCDNVYCSFDGVDEIIDVIPKVDGVVEVVGPHYSHFKL